MPFVKKNNVKGSANANDTRLFIGRTNELFFFTEHILKPEDPAYNMLSIYGDGGVGKTTLVQRFMDEANTPAYKAYCLTAFVDERHATLFSILKEFSEQLDMRHEFKRARGYYNEAVRKFQMEQTTARDAILERAPDLTGAAFEGVPLVGPLVREGVKLAASQAMKGYHSGQMRSAVERLEDPIEDLTRAFIIELNRLAETQVALEGPWLRRKRRVLLFFDTFEQLADEVVPWLLDYLLPAELSSNIVLVVSGRTPLEYALPDERKRWLPYSDNNVIYSFSLNSFSEAETRDYLEKRGIVDPDQVRRIWHLSRGLPLYLSLLTSDSSHEVDPTADVVANFLHWIPQHEEVKRRLVLDAALFSRPFNQDDLAAFDYIKTPATLYRWLVTQPFVRKNAADGRYRYHELAQDLLSRHLHQSSPQAYYTTRKALVSYYQHCLASVQIHSDQDIHQNEAWSGLTIALAEQLFFLPDQASHSQAVELLLDAYERTGQDEAVTRMLRDLTEEQHALQMSDRARSFALALLAYIEAEPMSEGLLQTSNQLLEHIVRVPSFSARLLAHIHGQRGVALRTLNRHQEALQDFTRALTLDPDYFWAYGNRGITYRALRRYEEALRDFNRALELDNTLDWIFAARGEVYRHLKEYELARQDFDQALALDSDYAQAYVGRGRLYRMLQRYEESLADFNRAIAIDPELEWAYGQRGETYRVLKQYTQALADYTQAIALNPEYFWAYAQRGETYRQLKQYHRAIEEYSRAIELDPDYSWAYGSRGLTYFALKDYQHALADYNRALEINPTYAWAYGQRGKTYRHLKDYVRAIEDFDRALELDPQDFWAYSHRGLCYASLQDYRQAIADCERALAINPAYARSYGHRGSAYLYLGDIAQALADYEHNCTLDPQDLQACWMYVWISMDRQRADTTIAERLEHIAAQDPRQAIAALCRGVALWLKGLPQQALLELQRAQQLRPTMWDVFFWQGLIMADGGNADGTLLWERALELGMPPALLTPLHWLAQPQPGLFRQYAQPLLAP